MTMHNDDFDLLNVFAHDLKLPLNAVRGYLQLISLKGDLNSQQQHYYERTFSAVERMETMIAEMLAYARMEAKPMTNLRPCNVVAMLEDIVLLLEVSASERAIHISTDITAGLPQLIGDETMLRHALTNVIGNAVKYNDDGGEVWIRAQHLTANNMVELRIQDNGIGIKPEHLSQIFERFYRADSSDRSRPGTGLGLTIVKMVVDKHGGQIDVESAYGEGTEFRILLPAAPKRYTSNDPGEHGGFLGSHEPLDDMDDNMQENPEHPDSDSREDGV